MSRYIKKIARIKNVNPAKLNDKNESNKEAIVNKIKFILHQATHSLKVNNSLENSVKVYITLNS